MRYTKKNAKRYQGKFESCRIQIRCKRSETSATHPVFSPQQGTGEPARFPQKSCFRYQTRLTHTILDLKMMNTMTPRGLGASTRTSAPRSAVAGERSMDPSVDAPELADHGGGSRGVLSTHPPPLISQVQCSVCDT